MESEAVVRDGVQGAGGFQFIICIAHLVYPSQKIQRALDGDLVLYEVIFPGMWQEFLLEGD